MAGSAYNQLPKSLSENLKPLSTSNKAFVKTFMQDIIGEGNEDLYMKMEKKALMVDTLPKTKIKKRNRALGLSAKQKKALGLYEIPKDKQNKSINYLKLTNVFTAKLQKIERVKEYEKFIPLNKLWESYMKQLLHINEIANLTLGIVENKLLKADYHGALFKVTKSKCSTYVGATGIVIKETRNMFYLITEGNKMTGIPKHNSFFEFQLDGYVFEIFGTNFRFRPGERSARKFKKKMFLT